MKKYHLEDLPFVAIPMALLENLSVDDVSYALDIDRREVLAGMLHTRQALAIRANLDNNTPLGRALSTEPSFREFIRGLSRYIDAPWSSLLSPDELLEREQLFGYFRAVKAHIRATMKGSHHVQARSHS